MSYSGIGVDTVNITLNDYTYVNCVAYTAYTQPAISNIYTSSTIPSGRYFFDVFVQISNIANQLTLPYVEVEAQFPNSWFSSTTMAELRIAEMNAKSVGH